jgi:hypothetical protein
MLFNQLISPGATQTSFLHKFVSPETVIPCLQPMDVAEVVISVLAMPERIQVQ